MVELSPQYLAALLDSEGTIVLGKLSHGYSRTVQISGTYLPILEALQGQFGGHIYKQPKNVLARKRCFIWNLNKKTEIVRFLQDIIPYMHEKKSQAEIMMSVCQLPHGRGRQDVLDLLDQAFMRLKALKRFDYDEAFQPGRPVGDEVEVIAGLKDLLKSTNSETSTVMDSPLP